MFTLRLPYLYSTLFISLHIFFCIVSVLSLYATVAFVLPIPILFCSKKNVTRGEYLDFTEGTAFPPLYSCHREPPENRPSLA